MDHLKAGIGLRGYAQVDPKIAFKKESYQGFQEMLESMEDSVTDMLLKVDFREPEALAARPRMENVELVHEDKSGFKEQREAAIAGSQQQGEGSNKARPVRAQKEPGRNDPCPCGKKRPDGRPMKYKDCCGR
jgi:preprotein translocase subunit SecA